LDEPLSPIAGAMGEERGELSGVRSFRFRYQPLPANNFGIGSKGNEAILLRLNSFNKSGKRVILVILFVNSILPRPQIARKEKPLSQERSHSMLGQTFLTTGLVARQESKV
jgi:hypothetical protein